MARRPPSKGKPRVIRRRRFVKRRGNKMTNVNRGLQPIPSRYICKMKYATTVTTDATGQYIFNLNSLYDPDRTGLGHQPYGFDNLALLYNRYRVISTGYRVIMPTSTTGTPITVSALPSNDLGITFADDSVIRENPRAKYIVQNPGATALVLHGKVHIPSLMGRTRAQYMADDNYQAVVTSNPSEQALLYLGGFNALTGAPLQFVALNVILEFTVEWFDIKHVVQS